ncbi:MAG TPA: hypothetical protein VJ648_01515, partial [Vicinamibacteria bacterium]|nr:hypothetical protein [Vicinamibacteria bacterium]
MTPGDVLEQAPAVRLHPAQLILVRPDHVLDRAAASEHLRLAEGGLGLEQNAGQVSPVVGGERRRERQRARVVGPAIDEDDEISHPFVAGRASGHGFRFDGLLRHVLLPGNRGEEPVCMAWVTILAFIRISTNPRIFEAPLGAQEAIAIVSSWLARPAVSIL